MWLKVIIEWGTNEVRMLTLKGQWRNKGWLNPNVLRSCYEDGTELLRSLYLPFFSKQEPRVEAIILVFSFVVFPDRVMLFAWFVSLFSMNAYMMDEQLSQSKYKQIFNLNLQLPDMQLSDFDDRRSVCWQRTEKVVTAVEAGGDRSIYIVFHKKVIWSMNYCTFYI
jgi:hypothetical protein